MLNIFPFQEQDGFGWYKMQMFFSSRSTFPYHQKRANHGTLRSSISIIILLLLSLLLPYSVSAPIAYDVALETVTEDQGGNPEHNIQQEILSEKTPSVTPKDSSSLSHTVTGAITFQRSTPLSSDELTDLEEQSHMEGWTFSVGENTATVRSLDQLCGATPPDESSQTASSSPLAQSGSLPDSFDWRVQGGCTPIKNQGSCGSCWAFATVAPLECNILIKDHIVVDLSEQWLISCNREGWGCNGGWFAHDYYQSKTDFCGGTGAVLEQYCPYRTYDAACSCPYPHDYFIDDWHYVYSAYTIPSTSLIKQAILTYGPVSVGVTVGSAFQAYNGGVFNAQVSGSVNHLVTLVGWDDNQGNNGVWILRNSWGTGWGENGYMRIEYGCSHVGYAASYIEYTGGGAQNPVLSLSPSFHDFGSLGLGDTASTTFEIWNDGTGILNYTITETCSFISVTPQQGSSTGEHDHIQVTVDTEGLSLGSHSCNLQITSEGGNAIFTVSFDVVTQDPILALSPSSLDFGVMGLNQQEYHVFYLWNEGTGQLSYTLTESCSWLSLSPSSGSSTGEHDSITVNVDTTGLSQGSYATTISIQSNGGNENLPVALQILEEDQRQDTYSGYKFPVYGNRWYAQSFTPSLSTLGHLQLFIGKGGNPPSPLSISLRNSLSGGDLVQTSISPGLLTSTPTWIDIDVPDFTVTPGQTYYIVVKTVGGSASSTYLWGCGVSTSYSMGCLWYTSTGGTSWQSYQQYDFCFITYGQGATTTAQLSYTPTSYDFGIMTEGQTRTTTFTLWNAGSGTLTYSCTPSASWAEVSPSQGTSTGEHDTLTITIDAEGLSLGTHQCSIDLTSNGGSGTFTITATIIAPSPILSYSPQQHDFGDLPPGTTTSTTFDLWNSGTDQLTYSLSESASWLTLSPESGTSTGEHDTITVAIDTTALATGAYQQAITLTSNGGTGTFTVTFTVVSQTPVLSFSPLSYSCGMMPTDTTTTASFEIWNSGTGTLSYSLAESCSWVSVAPLSGVSSGEHDSIGVVVDTSGLAVGVYHCDVVVDSNGGNGVFAVNLEVVAGVEVVDQVQSVYGGYRFGVYGDRWCAQSFVPSLGVLSRVQVLVGKGGSPSGSLVVSVREVLDGPDLTVGVVDPGEVSYGLGWLDVDVADIGVVAGETYYLVVRTSGGSVSHSYVWGYGDGGLYGGGCLWYSGTAGGQWNGYPLYDCCFKTYGLQ
jgi:C1A family cysteine protease